MLFKIDHSQSSYLNALKLLVLREISSRYKGTMMGGVWLLLQPLIMVVVYSFVFSVIMKVRIPGMDNSYHFALYLMAAMMPFSAFQDSILSASQSLFTNSSLLHKSTLPPIMYPLIPMLSTIVTELIALGIIVIAAYLLLNQISYYLLLLPVLVLIRICFSISIGYIVSILSVFIPDLRQALGLLLTMLLFLTPVFYPVEMIPEHLLPLNNLNPMYHLLDAYRSIILRGEFPAIGFFYTGGFSILLLILSVYFYNSTIERAKEFI